MSVWVAEVHYSTTGSLFPDASTFPGVNQAPDFGVGFRASGNGVSYELRIRMLWSNAGGTEWRAQATGLVDTPGGDVFTSSIITYDFTQTVQEATGNDGDAFRDGGWLRIEKNGDAGTFSFITPLGAFGNTLASVGDDNTTPLRVEQIGQRHRIPAIDLADSTLSVRWTNFFSLEDGERFRGAAMTALQPGTWNAWVRDAGFGGLSMTFNTSQENSYYLAEQVNTTADAFANQIDVRTRQWAGGDTVDFFARELDQTWAPEHGIIWRLFSTSSEPEKLFCERTFDNGGTWERFTVNEGETIIPGEMTFPASPSIVWFARILIAVWSDGEHVVQMISHDLGRNWESQSGAGLPVAPIVLEEDGIPPRYPRACVHPSGLLFYFFMREDTILLRRSGDFGLTFTDGPDERIVVTGVDDEPFDAFCAYDESVRVRYVGGGLRAAYSSQDHGAFWDSFELINPTLDHRWRSTTDHDIGLTYHVAWRPTVPALQAYASPDFGTLETPDQAGNTVDDTVDEQTAGISMMANGGTLVSYFDFNENLVEKFSLDFAQRWD